MVHYNSESFTDFLFSSTFQSFLKKNLSMLHNHCFSILNKKKLFVYVYIYVQLLE